jgi:hypothetical protein
LLLVAAAQMFVFHTSALLRAVGVLGGFAAFADNKAAVVIVTLDITLFLLFFFFLYPLIRVGAIGALVVVLLVLKPLGPCRTAAVGWRPTFPHDAHFRRMRALRWLLLRWGPRGREGLGKEST